MYYQTASAKPDPCAMAANVDLGASARPREIKESLNAENRLASPKLIRNEEDVERNFYRIHFPKFYFIYID